MIEVERRWVQWKATWRQRSSCGMMTTWERLEKEVVCGRTWWVWFGMYLWPNRVSIWRRKWQLTPVNPWTGSLVGCCPWGRRGGHNWRNLAAAAGSLCVLYLCVSSLSFSCSPSASLCPSSLNLSWIETITWFPLICPHKTSKMPYT